jgi:glutamate 5-kinase
MNPKRAELSQCRRVVVKIGSRVLATDPELPARLAAEIVALRAKNRSFALVSSGAIAIGCARLGYGTRPREVARLQAAAAAGQSVLMRRYDEAFAAHGAITAQVLLTHSDLADRERLNNARNALGALIEAGALPIVNENDTVAVDEIRFGDNDQLAAMVVPLLQAELLVLLTDVTGVLDAEGQRISVMTDDARIGNPPGGVGGAGSGGIQSKLDAARKACRSGAFVVVASGLETGTLTRVIDGDDVGTLFAPPPAALRARKHWIAFTLRPRGALVLDAGAAQAVGELNRSLLPVGVIGVRGQFNAGDSVSLLGPDGVEIGRGLTRLGTLDVARAAGRKGKDLEILFGSTADVVVVHRDDLVLTS